MQLPKVKIGRGISDDDLKRIKEANIKKLKARKQQGATKESLYLNFPKKFVDEHY